ncbi:MAG: hypothetical protein M3044_06600 [Thermoproteota archaeon]|nr:hypothetical protein [Thermoproteota archaeon]
MKAICQTCSSKRQQGKELKIITQSRLITHHLHFHPTHSISIIEAEDYNEFGFKKYTGQKSYGRIKK